MGFGADYTICSLRGKDFKFASEENLVPACAELLRRSTQGHSRGRFLIAKENVWNAFAYIPEAVGDISETIRSLCRQQKATWITAESSPQCGDHVGGAEALTGAFCSLCPCCPPPPWPPIPIPVCAVTCGPESPGHLEETQGKKPLSTSQRPRQHGSPLVVTYF